MKVFIYDKKKSKLFATLMDVRSIEETEKHICFTFSDKSTYEIEKKIYKTTAYQN